MTVRTWLGRAVAFGSALAMLSAIGVRPAAAFTNVPDDTWMTNGIVRAVIAYQGYVYIGGKFSRVFENEPGTPGASFAATNLARFDAATGVADKTWTPDVTGDSAAAVWALAAANDEIFVGGYFRAIDGVARQNLAGVSAVTGVVDPNLDAVVGSDSSSGVRALIVLGTRLYVGGYFLTVDGLARKRLAAFDLYGNLVAGWRPRVDLPVATLLADCTGTTIFVGGKFDQAAGTGAPFELRKRLARFDVTTGALEPWAPVDSEIGNGLRAFDLALSCPAQTLYVAMGGQNYIFALDISDDVGNTVWNLQTSGNVQAVAVDDFGTADTSDDRVLFGGHFGGGVAFPPGMCSVSKPHLDRFAVVDLNGNCDLSWTPSFEGKFLGPWDILVTNSGSQVWVGGQFTEIGNSLDTTAPFVPQYFIARFTN